MTRQQVESLIRRAYDLGYKEGLYDKKQSHSDKVIEQVSDDAMIEEFLKNNEITQVGVKELDPSQSGAQRTDY